MPIDHRLPQTPSDVVSIAGWPPDEDFPVGPQGAKPKRVVICPQPPPHPFLIGGHRYLFKEPTGSRAQQIWSEVIAYEVARELGVAVPPAFLAFDPRTAAPGVLVEFFYGHIWEGPSRFVHAVELFQRQGMRIEGMVGRDNRVRRLDRQHGPPLRELGIPYPAATAGRDPVRSRPGLRQRDKPRLRDPGRRSWAGHPSGQVRRIHPARAAPLRLDRW